MAGSATVLAGPSPLPDATLRDFLHARALATSQGRLVLDVVGGAAVAGTAWWAKPAGWTLLATAGLSFSMYGLWAAAERRLQPGPTEMPEFIEFAWLSLRTGAAVIGGVAFLIFLFALLGLTLGTWIS